MALKHQAPRGTRDLLPDDIGRWQWAEQRAADVCARYGYREIRTPIFEDYELFARTSGESSDVVEKEMYRFKDLKGRDLALRPEGTAGVCRAYLERSLAGTARVQKLWYAGPMFRYGRPQKGRYRQFWQIGAEIIGTLSPLADIEMIGLFVDIFAAWGFDDLTVTLNSLGTTATRHTYAKRLREWLEPLRDQLSGDSQRRLETNPLRVLDSKDRGDLALLSGPHAQANPVPRMLDVLDAEAREHWEAVTAGLTAIGVRWEIDHGLVRGLDYYTRTTFEVHDRSLGAQSALGGGGRYDGLIESLGGQSTPGVGFSIGLDRAMLVLESRGLAGAAAGCQVYVVAMEATQTDAQKLVRQLRRTFSVDCDLEARSFKNQMKAAGKSGAHWMVLLGEEEWARGEVVLKNLESGDQLSVARDQLHETLRANGGKA